MLSSMSFRDSLRFGVIMALGTLSRSTKLSANTNIVKSNTSKQSHIVAFNISSVIEKYIN